MWLRNRRKSREIGAKSAGFSLVSYQNPLSSAAESPVIFQTEDNAAFLSDRQTFGQRIDYPFEPLFIRATGEARLNSFVIHQLLKTF